MPEQLSKINAKVVFFSSACNDEDFQFDSMVERRIFFLPTYLYENDACQRRERTSMSNLLHCT